MALSCSALAKKECWQADQDCGQARDQGWVAGDERSTRVSRSVRAKMCARPTTLTLHCGRCLVSTRTWVP
eukprot:484937-Rhodomonas_salina.1